MPRGFIQSKLDLKLLILYILARLVEPVELSALTDLVLCDEGVDYFAFSEALAELVDSGHVSLEDACYAITEKGRESSEVCESDLPFSVRSRCDQNTGALNAILRRNSQVKAQVQPRAGGGLSVCLSLEDDAGLVLALEMLALSESQANRLSANFKEHAEQIYNAVLTALLADYDAREVDR